MTVEKYIPLHLHTAKGSIGDSILKIKQLVEKAKTMGLDYLAATNHGSMADMYDFYNACVEKDITPIIGCEVYETQDRTYQAPRKNSDEMPYWHLVLIAKNEIGLKNLLYITTDAQLNGFYYKPRTDLSVLREHGEGIIALSACLGGRLPQELLKINKPDANDIELDECYDNCVAIIEDYKSIFDEFYLEIQPGDFQEQQFVNELLVRLSEATDTPLVVTNDVHYLNEEDWYAHDVHVKISRKQKLEDAPVYPDRCYYLQSYNSILNSFPNLNIDVVRTAINNTVLIAQSCNLNLKSNHLHMPRFGVPTGFTEETYLEKITFERLDDIYNVLVDPAEYVSRLIYELSVICELGFAGYFLTVRDFVTYAKENGIPVGPGRGSVCGSLVSFLCGITAVDPIRYDLLFERFLSVHRKGSIPDVDLDFANDKREQMFNYAVRRHGGGRCALVSTFGLRKAKASLRDTAKVFNIPAEIADEAAKLIPVTFYDDDGEKTTDLSIEDSLQVVPRLREIFEQYPEWFEMSILLEDLPRVASIHPAGTLVSPVELIEHVPLIKPNNENINATSLNLADAEKAGFVKFDFLSLATLSVIDATEKDVNFKFDFINNEFDDEDTWNLIGSKYTTCLFQIASKTYKDRMHRLKPKTIKELAACLALVRGPCISAKDDVKYMEILEGKREIELIHPLYDSVTASTNGILLYQEQLMKICVNFGFSLEDGYKIMKASAKKKFDTLRSYEEKFMELAQKKNVCQDIADRIFKMIVDSGLYSFNESHAIAYALLCYQSAYLKAHFPREYMKNALTNAYLRKEEIEDTVNECRRLGFKFASLDVNESNWEFSLLDDGCIRIGMCAIKSFGEGAFNEVAAKRPFDDFAQFLEMVEKKNCSKRAIVPAIFAGLFDCFEPDRRRMFEYFCELRDEVVVEDIKLQGQKETFNIGDSYDTIEELILGAPLISTPVNNFIPIGFDNLKKNAKFEIDAVIRRVKKHKDSSDNNMAFLSLETADGHIDCIVFSTAYERFKKLCKKNLIVRVTAKKDSDESCILMDIA